MQAHRFIALGTACLISGLGAVTMSVPVSADKVINARATGFPAQAFPAQEFSAQEFSAQARQRPRVRVTPDRPAAYDYPRPGDYSWPGPGAVRQCVDWYAIEHRPSGTVVTPQMRCRWVRG